VWLLLPAVPASWPSPNSLASQSSTGACHMRPAVVTLWQPWTYVVCCAAGDGHPFLTHAAILLCSDLMHAKGLDNHCYHFELCFVCVDPTCHTDFHELLIWRTGCLVKLLSRIKDLRFTTKSGQPCLDLRLPGHACPHADRPRGPDAEILSQLAPLLKDLPHVDLHVVDLDQPALAALGSGLGPSGVFQCAPA
jgi:hypothetical protein